MDITRALYTYAFSEQDDKGWKVSKQTKLNKVRLSRILDVCLEGFHNFGVYKTFGNNCKNFAANIYCELSGEDESEVGIYLQDLVSQAQKAGEEVVCYQCKAAALRVTLSNSQQ